MSFVSNFATAASCVPLRTTDAISLAKGGVAGARARFAKPRSYIPRRLAVRAQEAVVADKVTPVDHETALECINTVRFLAIDGVDKANSGHPGLPMGAAPMGFVLYNEYLRYNPKNPKWFNRDRFVLSAGHGCMLLYSLMYLTGYDSVKVQIRVSMPCLMHVLVCVYSWTI